ncbi:hypothetical protein AAG906_018595 [Vitis piasezkii]
MMRFGPATIDPNNSGDAFPCMTPALTPTVVPTTIVPEVLTESNYENWSTCLKWYLVGQDLWEVCQTKDIPDEARDPEAFSVWEKKNAMALHAIQISCSGRFFLRLGWNLVRVTCGTFEETVNCCLSLNCERKISPTGDTALHIAARAGHEKVVEELVKNWLQRT